MRRILFVCTGNTCRSPMAEALLKSKSELEVKSAGVFALEDNPASSHTIDVLKEKKIELDHCSQVLTKELVNWAELILTMTTTHKQYVLQKFPTVLEKTFTLKEFVNDGEGDLDISDPFGGTIEVYRHTRDEIEDYIDQTLARLAKWE